MAFEYAVVLTGGIATGKSSATTLLSLYGFRLIDADKIAHQLLEREQQQIANIFGSEYIREGRVDRAKLGGLIFDNKEKRLQLEALLHPLIYDEIAKESQIQDAYGKPYIVDIPLFFEHNRYPIKNSIVVYAPKETQLERLIKRDGFTKEQALRRIEAQVSIEEKRQKATFVIDNSKDLKHLQRECDGIKEKILSAYQ